MQCSRSDSNPVHLLWWWCLSIYLTFSSCTGWASTSTCVHWIESFLSKQDLCIYWWPIINIPSRYRCHLVGGILFKQEISDCTENKSYSILLQSQNKIIFYSFPRQCQAVINDILVIVSQLACRKPLHYTTTFMVDEFSCLDYHWWNLMWV